MQTLPSLPSTTLTVKLLHCWQIPLRTECWNRSKLLSECTSLKISNSIVNHFALLERSSSTQNYLYSTKLINKLTISSYTVSPSAFLHVSLIIRWFTLSTSLDKSLPKADVKRITLHLLMPAPYRIISFVLLRASKRSKNNEFYFINFHATPHAYIYRL